MTNPIRGMGNMGKLINVVESRQQYVLSPLKFITHLPTNTFFPQVHAKTYPVIMLDDNRTIEFYDYQICPADAIQEAKKVTLYQ